MIAPLWEPMHNVMAKTMSLIDSFQLYVHVAMAH